MNHPVFRKMTLKDKELVEGYFKAYQPLASEMTFANLHALDNKYNTFISEIDGFLVLVCGRGNHCFCLFPVYKNREDLEQGLLSLVLTLKEAFDKEGLELMFDRVTEEEKELLIKVLKIANIDAEVVYDRDNSDYVYTYENMTYLKGKKYHKKRNHIRYLLKNYQVEAVPISKELLPECTKVLDGWHKGREDDPEMVEEKISQQQFIDGFFDYTDLRGILVRVDGVAKAYTIGSMLNQDTIVVHSEKADGSIRGLYPYINQHFLQTQFKDKAWVNREQDCGSEGLRKAKLSYYPTKMIEKHKIYIRR